MKYSTEIIIAMSRQKVVALFDSTDNMFKWQEGLVSLDLLEGEARQEGARSRLVFDSRKGKLEMTETITRRNLPETFTSTYHTRGVFNEVTSLFEPMDDHRTRWRMDNVFRFRGLMALMAPFMKGAFQANTLLNMERFRTFAENEAGKD